MRKETRPISVDTSPSTRMHGLSNSFAGCKLDAARDRKAIEEDGEKSPALQAVTNKFLAYHLASYGCNMATIGASFCYAVGIAMKILSERKKVRARLSWGLGLRAHSCLINRKLKAYPSWRRPDHSTFTLQ